MIKIIRFRLGGAGLKNEGLNFFGSAPLKNELLCQNIFINLGPFSHTLPHSLTLFLSLSFTPFTLLSHFKRPLGNIAPLGGGGVEVVV